jgi:hypothetical protein
MRRRTLLISVGAGLVSACGEAIDRQTMDGEPVAVATLDADLTLLKTAFNASEGDVRLVFIVGPSCGPCLRGLIDLNQSLGSSLLSNDRLRVLVVHVPTLGAELHHAERAAQLMGGSSVMHFWDPSGHSGDAVQRALQVSDYAWDVWLTYGPEPTWDAETPPEPATWSHQLGSLPASKRLDPEAFAADVRQRVEQLA